MTYTTMLMSLLEDVRLPLPPELLFVIFSFLFVGWIVFSIILRYHWKKYGSSKLTVMQMEVIYFIGSGVLFVSMATSALLYIMTQQPL